MRLAVLLLAGAAMPAFAQLPTSSWPSPSEMPSLPQVPGLPGSQFMQVPPGTPAGAAGPAGGFPSPSVPPQIVQPPTGVAPVLPQYGQVPGYPVQAPYPGVPAAAPQVPVQVDMPRIDVPTRLDITDAKLNRRQTIWDTGAKPGPGQSDVGRLDYDYVPGRIMSVRVRESMPSTIVLPPWERLTPHQILRGNSHIVTTLLGPNSIDVRITALTFDAGLKVVGSTGVIYQFRIDAVSVDYKAAPDTTVVVHAPGPATPAVAGYAPVAPALVAYAPTAPAIPAAPATGLQPGSAATPPPLPSSSTAPAPAAARKLPLPEPLATILADRSDLTAPHILYERGPGDFAAIAPRRIVEDRASGLTYFDFGDDAQNRPRPTIQFMQDKIDRPVNLYTNPNHPQIVIADRIGSFTFKSELRMVCAERSTDSFAGLKVAAAK